MRCRSRRTVPSPVITVAVLAIAPTIVNTLRGGHDSAGALTAASIIAGAGAGYIADDPAAPTLESSPTPLGTRRGCRATMVAGMMAVAWLTSVLATRRTPASTHLALRRVRRS